MKRWLSLILVLIFVPLTVFADYDLSKLTDDELYTLMDDLQAELEKRNQAYVKGSVDAIGFYAAEYAMLNYLQIKPDYSDSEFVNLNSDYTAHINNGIRLLKYNNRIMKVSVRLDPEDSESSVNRMYLIASIFEEKLFEIDDISSAEKKKAFKSAQNIVDTALDLFGDNLVEVFTSGKEGYSLLAATGIYVYVWEYINGSVWLSVALTSLPDGIN